MTLVLCPITIAEAKEFVARYHRHHKPPQGAKFAIGCTDGKEIVGVIMVGRPVARLLDNGWTAEVTRCCTDGTEHVPSKLYAAAWRAARAMGYRRLITYLLDYEPGTSVKAAGWRCVGQAGGGTWDRPNRSRVDKHPVGQKQLWEVCASS